MKKWLALVLGMALPSAGYAAYDDMLKEWVGATQEELVAKWGYPQSANDYVKIDDEITVFSYRSFRDGFIGPAPCVVSFTIRNKTVIAWKREGENCPRNKR